jgi:hypothetical protein
VPTAIADRRLTADWETNCGLRTNRHCGIGLPPRQIAYSPQFMVSQPFPIGTISSECLNRRQTRSQRAVGIHCCECALTVLHPS